MKLILILAACVLAATATPMHGEKKLNILKPGANLSESDRSMLINLLIRQLFELIRRIINNGSGLFGIPPLDPLVIEHLQFYVPAVLINFEMEINNGQVTGIGDFVVHRSHLELSELSFDIDISVPNIKIKADHYKLLGDLYTAIPFYGEGVADLVVQEFRLHGKLFLKQSEDGQSILIDRIENPGFSIERLKADFTGIIGGGDVDAVANAIIEDVIPDYMNRFNRVIGLIAAEAAVFVLNPILDQLDSWRYIELLL